MKHFVGEWEQPTEIIPPDEFIEAVGGHPIIAKTLFRRGIKDIQSAMAYLDPSLYKPTSAFELQGVEKAVDILIHAQKKHQNICVWGDFDVDGQTATALLVSALQNLGLKVIFHVPLRSKESHGVDLPQLKKIINDPYNPAIDILLTCDTGISSYEPINYATQHGIKVIITDHHDLPQELPAAASIINPKMLPDNHALCALTGVGTAYKLVEALYQKLNKEGETDKFMDLVALGTVADVAELVGDNRYLLQKGLECLKDSNRIGLKALFELINLNSEELTEEHIGYLIGPRLNAVGRLDNAEKGVELLLTGDPVRASVLALEFETLNSRRKLLTNQVYMSAAGILEINSELFDHQIIILDNPLWPVGVIGIAASRLVEQFGKPVILISSPEGEVARGSARSIPGVDISKVINTSKDLLIDCGGHPMAAGLVIESENIPAFKSKISDTVKRMAPGDKPKILIDGFIPLSQVSFEFIEQIERLAPFGLCNPPLVLVSEEMSVDGIDVIGREDEHLQVVLLDKNEHKFKTLYWNGAGRIVQEQFDDILIDLAYSVRTSSYRGKKQKQIEWRSYRKNEGVPPPKTQEKYIEVHDYRDVVHPLEVLISLCPESELLILAESDAKNKLNAFGKSVGKNLKVMDRFGLKPEKSIIIWTTPPSMNELKLVLELVSPEEIVFFCVEPDVHDLESFLEKLIGLVKFGLKKYNGQLQIKNFAAALAQREFTVRKGLDYLEASGKIEIISTSTEHLKVQAVKRKPWPELDLIKKELTPLINETCAFRNYVKTVDLDVLKSGI